MESEYKCLLLSCCGKRWPKYLEGAVDSLNAGARSNKLQARTTFGHQPKRCVTNGDLRPPARHIPARTIQLRRPLAARQTSVPERPSAARQ